MRCAVLYGLSDLRIEDRPIPKTDSEYFLLRVENCGVCGTDLRIFRHGHPKIKYPLILGHQVVGKIASSIPESAGLKEGDRVLIWPSISCGRCHWCQIGADHLCIGNSIHIGFNIDGGYAEYMRVPYKVFTNGVIMKMPDSVSSEEGGLIEPLACVLHAQKRIGVKQGDTVLVMGAGPVGLMHIMLVKPLASKVIAAEISEDRLKNAERFGADVVLNARSENFVSSVKEVTDKLGAHVVIVANSSGRAQEQALRLVRKIGKVNYFGALPPDNPTIAFESNLIQQQDVTIIGTYGAIHKEFLEALELVRTKKIDLKPLITHRFTIDEVEKALKAVESGEAIHATIEGR